MNRYRQIKSVAFKELIDYIRDWRTLVAIVLVPVLLFPLLFVALPLLLESEFGERQEFELTVAIQDDDLDDKLRSQLLILLFLLTIFVRIPAVFLFGDVNLDNEWGIIVNNLILENPEYRMKKPGKRLKEWSMSSEFIEIEMRDNGLGASAYYIRRRQE